VDWASGACLLIRRDLYEAIGPLDEGFFWGSEDVDYCYRAHLVGRKVLYTPQPPVVHRIGASTNQAPIRTILNFHRSMARLYRKHMAHSVLDFTAITFGVALRAGLLIASWWLRNACARVLSLVRGRG
jgi:GT2 family glycosyltransferase